MERNKASLTAQRIALRRAAHQLLDKPPVFEDPFALRIIGKEAAADLRAHPDRYETTRLSPFIRAFAAARSRFAEDELARSVQRGTEQYVILGAGLDTFACRNPFSEILAVFELDHPATQKWKLDILGRNGLASKGKCTFIAADLSATPLNDALRNTGFRSDSPAFFSCLGVSQYLDKAVFHSILKQIAAASPDSGIAFDYTTPPADKTPGQKNAFASIERAVSSLGEPWVSFFTPGELADKLREAGFSDITDLGGDELNAKYFSGRNDGLRVGSLSRVVRARR